MDWTVVAMMLATLVRLVLAITAWLVGAMLARAGSLYEVRQVFRAPFVTLNTQSTLLRSKPFAISPRPWASAASRA
jgi:hypothetical protein